MAFGYNNFSEAGGTGEAVLNRTHMRSRQLYNLIKIKNSGRTSLFFQHEEENDFAEFDKDEMSISTGDKLYNYVRYKKDNTVNYLEKALKTFYSGKHLSTLTRSEFINFIAEIFEAHGWKVFVSESSHDCYLSMLVIKNVRLIGQVRCVLLIRKILPKYKVKAEAVEKLKKLMFETGSCKGVLITTGGFTLPALESIGKNSGSIFYWDYAMISDGLRSFLITIRANKNKNVRPSG